MNTQAAERGPDLEQDCEAAWQEWEASGDEAAVIVTHDRIFPSRAVLPAS